MIELLISTVISMVITWLITRYYYKKKQTVPVSRLIENDKADVKLKVSADRKQILFAFRTRKALNDFLNKMTVSIKNMLFSGKSPEYHLTFNAVEMLPYENESVQHVELLADNELIKELSVELDQYKNDDNVKINFEILPDGKVYVNFLKGS